MVKEVRKPWGNFKEFIKNKKCTVKIIEVKSGQELSLQYHNHREEFWYFLDDGYAVIGKNKIKVKEGSFLKIPKKTSHRAIAGSKRMKFLEISKGNFSEKDIVRLDDKYGRIK
jgi:mannose-6-phosphate isomerase-like protein (cupin superfamily)